MADTSFGLPPWATEWEEVIYITWPVWPPGPGDMNKSDNLSGLADYSVARTNLGLGTLATQSGTFSAKEDIANKSTSVTTDQASDTKYPSVKSVYDWATTTLSKYLGDADFYQYSISRTVDGSGNLTVALKNYEGNDPTSTKPVKIMIGGVVRTITSALSATDNAWGNTHNAWSAELATKEIDYFFYLWYDATYGIIPWFSRIPYASVMSDFSTSGTNEKYITTGVIAPWFIAGTSSFVNIGRFNATLSAGAGYTWSVPATSVIVNYPIFETRLLDYVSSIYGDTTAWTIWNGTITSKYSIMGSRINMWFNFTLWTTSTLAGWFFWYSKPFASTGIITYWSAIIQDWGNANGAYPLVISSNWFWTQNNVYSSPGTKVTSTFPITLGSGDNFSWSIIYNI
jgi:hypothetical protein